MITTQQVLDALSNVMEPDLKKDLVTLNMIQDVAVDGKKFPSPLYLQHLLVRLKNSFTMLVLMQLFI